MHTAGALRTSSDYVEDLPLIDQPEQLTISDGDTSRPPPKFLFHGERRLTRSESDGVRRAIRYLHAVVAGRDHSGGTVKSWRNLRQKPLEQAVATEEGQYPHLHQLLSAKTEFGLIVNCEAIAAELARLWLATGASHMEPQNVAAVIEAFVPVALTFASHEPMESVFEQARKAIRETASSNTAS